MRECTRSVATPCLCLSKALCATRHVFAAHTKLAWLATALGRPPAEASRYAATAAQLRQGLLENLLLPKEACNPPVGPCFADGQNVTHSSVQATMYVLGSGVLTPEEAVPFLPFLVARSTPFPRCSAALSHFLFEALYTIAEGQASPEAADFAFELLVRDGHRSWREMLNQGATMTLEHWYGVNFQKHTWAHPWAAGPAAIIVRRIYGIRPLDIGYRTVAVHPQPPQNLTHGAITVPSLRGKVAMSWEMLPGKRFAMTLSVPGNTKADVCLPVGLLPPRCDLTINGAAAPTSRPHAGQLCLAERLGGGGWQVATTEGALQSPGSE